MQAAAHALLPQAVGSHSRSECPLRDGAPRCLTIRLRTAFLHHLRCFELPRRCLMGGNDAHWVNVLANTGAILTLLHFFGAICKNPQDHGRQWKRVDVSRPDVQPGPSLDLVRARVRHSDLDGERADGAAQDRPTARLPRLPGDLNDGL